MPNTSHKPIPHLSRAMGPEAFDEVLGLEEQFYQDGFQQGLNDGVKAGRTEGRTFGLEKGFERYAEAGRYNGKALVWANRASDTQINTTTTRQSNIRSTVSCALIPRVPQNPRFLKHLRVFYAASELNSLSKENNEEAVSDFEDKMRRAQAKLKILEKLSDGKGGVQDGQNEFINNDTE